jgi:putative hydroxymethylpyrimidine transporter CytX
MDIRPIPPSERNLGARDFFFLWAGVAVSLAEIWAGGLLAPLGFARGVAAILLGHLIGNTLMALGGTIGSDHGITSMVSVRPSFGIRGSNLAAALNVAQLICWASIMLIIAGRAGAMLSPARGLLARDSFWIVLVGLGALLWAQLTGKKIWKVLQVAAVVGLASVLLLMTVESRRGLGSGVALPPSFALPFMNALDLVIAMPISWMPLVADYSRFARSTRPAFWSTWTGYFLVSSWMFVLGLSATLQTGSSEPQMQLLRFMGGIGLAAPALAMVVFSTITSGFPDVYSATCSMLNISGRLSARRGMWLAGMVSILVALVFPMERYQSFLVFIGSMFVPLFGVVLTDYLFLRRRKLLLAELDRPGGAFWYRNGFHGAAFAAWAAGFAIYQFIQTRSYPVGGSIPSMLVSGSLYYLVTERPKVNRV